MANNFEEIQKLSKDQLDHFSSTAAAVARGFQAIANETSDYSKRSLESTSSFIEKLVGAKSLETAIQLQSDFAKSQFEGFVAQANKVGEIYRDIAKDAWKPVENAIHRTTEAARPQ